MTHSDSGGRAGFLSVLAAPVLIFDIVAVFLFYLGWTYIYFLYYHFGVNVHALDIPAYSFFIYAYPVLAGHVTLFSALSLALILSPPLVGRAVAALGGNFAWFPSDGRQALRWYVAAFLIALFPISFYLAQTSAEESAADMRSGNAKTVHFVFKESASKALPADLLKHNEEGRLKLLTQTPNRFIVFLQLDVEEKSLPMGWTHVVFNSDVHLASVRMGNVRRKE